MAYLGHNFAESIRVTSLFSAFEAIFGPEHYFGGESHDFWECVCVLDGCVGVTANNDIYTLQKNQAILHPPGEFHRIWSAHGTSPHVIIMSFSIEGMPPMRDYIYHIGDETRRLAARTCAEATRLFRSTGRGIFTSKNAEPLELETCRRHIEIFILSVISGASAADSSDRSISAVRYRRIVHEMERNLGRRLSVDDLAELCEMSKSNMKKIFSYYHGEGIIKYFNDMKIKAAIPLLLEGKSVSEVASRFGFEEPCYFSTVFKRTTGFSPVGYVKRHADIS